MFLFVLGIDGFDIENLRPEQSLSVDNPGDMD